MTEVSIANFPMFLDVMSRSPLVLFPLQTYTYTIKQSTSGKLKYSTVLVRVLVIVVISVNGMSRDIARLFVLLIKIIMQTRGFPRTICCMSLSRKFHPSTTPAAIPSTNSCLASFPPPARLL